jgi:hypothetical protein
MERWQRSSSWQLQPTEKSVLCDSTARSCRSCLAAGAAISARYFLVNADHSAQDAASCPSLMVPVLGARFGNQTSYQSRVENCAFGTPRGGRRTVPILVPGRRGLPRRTTRTLTGGSGPRRREGALPAISSRSLRLIAADAVQHDHPVIREFPPDEEVLARVFDGSLRAPERVGNPSRRHRPGRPCR